MAISGHDIVAIMAWINIAINMVNMDIFAKNRKNVDCLWKQNNKKNIGWKIMAKTKIIWENTV